MTDSEHTELRVAEIIACHGGLSPEESVYVLPGGDICITAGDQDDAWAWDISRPLAEQLDETAADDAAADALENDLPVDHVDEPVDPNDPTLIEADGPVESTERDGSDGAA